LYPTGGGQPHDNGTIAWDGNRRDVDDVRKEGSLVWLSLAGDGPVPDKGATVDVAVDWGRRHALMRTHTALHVLCGVIWNEWRTAVTRGNMEPRRDRHGREHGPGVRPQGFRVRSTARGFRRTGRGTGQWRVTGRPPDRSDV